MKPPRTNETADLLRANEELRIRLAEAEETLRAIREGEVDAVVVSGAKGEQVYSLVGADSIYRLTVETMKEAALTLTFDGTILFCNAQFGQFVKSPLEKIIGRPLQDFVAEDNHAAATALLLAAQQQPVRQRLVFRGSDGSAVPAHIAANVLNQPDGQSICVVATDLTEMENSTELIQHLRHQQETLRESERSLAEAQRIAHVGSWEWDIPTGEVRWSAELYRIYGLDPATFVPTIRSFADFVHPDDRQFVERKAEEIVAHGVPADFEFRIISARGETRHIRTIGEVVAFDEHGKPRRMLGANQDITERKVAEQKLFETTQRLKGLMQAVPVGVSFSDDATCQRITGNPTVLEQFEVSDVDNLSASAPDAAVPGRKLRYFLDGREITDAELPLQRAVKENRVIPPMELEVHLPSGRQWFAYASGSPIHDENGNVIAGLAVTVDITDRKRAEEALRQNTLRLELLAGTAGELLRSAEPQKIIDSLCAKVMEHLDSQAFFNYLVEGPRLHLNAYAGIPAEEARRIEWLEFGAAVCGRVAQKGHRIVIEHIPTAGDERTSLVKSYGIKAYACHPLLNPGGSVIGTLSFGTSTREIFNDEDLALMKAVADLVAIAVSRMQSQAALQNAKETLERERDILQAVMNGAANSHLVYLDRDFNFVRVNEVYARTCGYRPEEMVGKNHFVLYPDAENEAIFRKVRDTGVPVACRDKPFVFPDQPQRGVTYWDWTLTPLKDEFGAVTGLIFSLFETTARKRAEDALRESEHRIQQALNVSRSFTFEWETSTDEVRRSASCEAIFGLSGEEVVRDTGQRYFQRIHPEDRERFVQMLRTLTPAVSQYNTEYRLVRGDGKIVVVEETGQGSFDDNGKMVRLVGVGTDITARKRAEESLRQAKEELEDRVKERTAELSLALEALRQRSEQLRSMAAELTMAEDRERQRLAHVLHDGLQQILVGARFRLALLTRSQDAHTRGVAAEVNDLLRESIEASRSLSAELTPPILRAGGLNPAVEWLGQWMREKHGLTVDVRIKGQAQPVAEEASTLLLNATRELLFNAVKHARVRTARVQLEWASDQVQITVADEGAGFDPSKLRAMGGTQGGVGLFSIRERLQLLGGRMEIESSPGQGSRFTLVYPLAASAPPQASLPPKESGAVAPAAEPVASGKIRVALADDHPIVRKGLAKLLGSEPDLEIVGEAGDGESAVQLARELRPDVILMDVSMPGMDGIEAARIIHADLPRVKVIGLSMFEEADRADAMRQAGAVCFLVKSSSSEEITAAIRGCIRQMQNESRTGIIER